MTLDGAGREADDELGLPCAVVPNVEQALITAWCCRVGAFVELHEWVLTGVTA